MHKMDAIALHRPAFWEDLLYFLVKVCKFLVDVVIATGMLEVIVILFILILLLWDRYKQTETYEHREEVKKIKRRYGIK